MEKRKMRSGKPEIPGFTLLSCCGSGTAGKVWLGMDRRQNLQAVRLVAKTENAALVRTERCGVKLCRSLGAGHVNLLKILDSGETADHLYCITDAADNLRAGSGSYEPDTLSGRMALGGLTFRAVLRCLDAILAGMGHLHEHGLAHCDLKPENILFVRGVLKIGDPGMVSPAGVRSPGGSAGFRPPWPATGKECDIYAFGKMIYLLCTREDPLRFPEIPEQCDLAAFMPLNEIALGCCERDSKRRFRDAGEIRRALNRAGIGRSSVQDLRCRAE